MSHTTEQRIRMKAYEIWLREGCPEGSDLRHWEMARKFIVGEEAKSTLTSRFYDVHELNEKGEPEEKAAPTAKRKASKH
ncbi:DUF2934 domain-containing protein [Labrys sp. KNU-23]|uniref:DUF2934 domain-containing protein n=1 Tax=Labrys sp. KNU-23 TaxID=2789216 RepID=UPI0011ED5BA6|nr:DUF2934 domain-containing protein [Labrys sp. KNU-23]QEN89507.1 DUF2934 domain-containing protein [Labrys sp. KNU-23]